MKTTKNVEQRLNEVRSFLQPGDYIDSTGASRGIADLCEIGEARRRDSREQAAGDLLKKKTKGAPSAGDSASEPDSLRLRLDAEIRGRKSDGIRLEALEKEVGELRARCGNLQAKLDGYSREQVVAQLTQERDGALERETRAQTNIARLEGLCRLRGVQRGQEVPNIEQRESSARNSQSFDQQLAVARTPEARSAILSEFAEAVKRGDVKA